MNLYGINQINHTTTMVNNSMRKISTGSNYPSVADNPSNYAILKRMEARVNSIRQSNNNVQNSNTMLNISASALSNTMDILSNMRSAVLNAVNETNTDGDRNDLQKTMNELLKQIDENSNMTYNGKYILHGDKQVVASIDGYDNLYMPDASVKGLGLDNIDLNDSSTALDKIDNALYNISGSYETVVDKITDVGALQQRMFLQSDNYTMIEENENNSISTIGDLDISAEVTKLKSNETQQQLAIYAHEHMLNVHNSLLKSALMNL